MVNSQENNVDQHLMTSTSYNNWPDWFTPTLHLDVYIFYVYSLYFGNYGGPEKGRLGLLFSVKEQING